MSDNLDEYIPYMAQVHNFDFPGHNHPEHAPLEGSYRGVDSNNTQEQQNDDQHIVNDIRYFAENNEEPGKGFQIHEQIHEHIENNFNPNELQHYNLGNGHYPSNDDPNEGTSDGFQGTDSSLAQPEQAQPNTVNEQQSNSDNIQQVFQNEVATASSSSSVPAMALQVSSLSNSYSHANQPGQSSVGAESAAPGPTMLPASDNSHLKSRCIEEEYAYIIHRSSSVSAKSSNTKYKCMFCNFQFVGGPQKIRVHLTGKRENGTRLSRCEQCPEEVRRKLEERMKAPKELANDIGLYDDDDVNTPSLPPRNVEEHHTIVLSRSMSSNSKSSNTRYKCIYCRFKFVGGPQKIRVHLTGQQEGGTRMSKCARAPPEVIEQMEHRRKSPKPDVLSTPSGSSLPHQMDGNGLMHSAHVGHPAMPAGASGLPSQHAFVIQQQQALLKQQQHHATQLQIQQQQLQQLQRQQAMQQHMHNQQQLQQQQQQHLHHYQHMHHHQQFPSQSPLHHQQHHSMQPPGGGSSGNNHHVLSGPHHMHQQHMMSLGQSGIPASAQMLMQQQQQHIQRPPPHMQHAHLSHHQQIPPHLLYHNAQSAQMMQHQHQNPHQMHHPQHPHQFHHSDLGGYGDEEEEENLNGHGGGMYQPENHHILASTHGDHSINTSGSIHEEYHPRMNSHIPHNRQTPHSQD